jgi:hypothetical protein
VVSLAHPQEPHGASPGELVAFVFAYLDLLARYEDALDRKQSPRMNPLPCRSFQEHGIGEPVLRWMLYQGHVEHLSPASGAAGGKAGTVLVSSVLLMESSCFALTEAGAVFADQFLANVFAEEENVVGMARELLLLGRLVPAFNAEKRVLSWGRHVLKCFRQPSPNQELILAAAEEMAWPEWFDDPLPRVQGTNPKIRLHDTIKALNRHQESHIVHFKGAGLGTRVGWDYRHPSSPGDFPE